ncbi:MAG: acyl-CoA carboxylase subunit beta [Halobacteria archaeon]
MEVRLKDSADESEARAIAAALSEHFDEKIAVYVGDESTPSVTENPPMVSNEMYEDGEPTEREEELLDEIEDIENGGPRKYRDRLEEQGKLFVRDRLDLWFDDGMLFEDGKFAAFDEWHETVTDNDDRLPADGLLTGAAEFDGRDVHFMANDFTVKAGSMAKRGVEKFLRMQERALQNGKPVVYLMDSSGGRIDQQSGFFANREGIGKYYYNHSMLSGRVPQICVLYGPCIAGAAYTPVFADFTVMVEKMSAMAIASPRMVKMVTGEDIEMDDLGGPEIHAEHSGSADLVAKDEKHACELVEQLITYLPDVAGEKPPKSEPKNPARSPNGIDSAIPESPNEAYDVKDLILRVVDAGSYFEVRPDYGGEILTAFARIDGRPVGVVANQPAVRSGAIFPDAAEKAADFIWKCDAYEIPLLYLCDTPGFMAGSSVEKDAILEKGKKMIYATSSATVPKQCVVVRKAYGAGIYAMSGPAYQPESTIALPSGEIAIMGPEAAINAVYKRKLDEIEDEEKRKEREQELREEYREDIDVHRMASEVVIDEIVPPSSLREELVNRYAFYEDIEKELPDKKHGTVI